MSVILKEVSEGDIRLHNRKSMKQFLAQKWTNKMEEIREAEKIARATPGLLKAQRLKEALQLRLESRSR
jgi:hypothetical protein